MTASDRGRVLQYRSMKLFFDARYIRTDFHDGISRFSTELAAEVVHMADVTFLICDEAQSAYLPKGANILTLHRPTSVREPFTAFILNKHRPDVVFSPLQTMGSIGRNFKLILTSHDMIYYHFRTPPQQFSPLLRASWFLYHLTYIPQRLALNGADTVVTVSETTKKSSSAHDLPNDRLWWCPMRRDAWLIRPPHTKKRHVHLSIWGRSCRIRMSKHSLRL